MLRIIRLAALAVMLCSWATSVHAAPGVHWYRCVFQAGHHRHCTEYLVRKAPRVPISYWKRCTPRPHGVACTRYPVFTRPQPAGYWTYAEVTAYTPMETPGTITADGTPVGIGVAAGTYPECAGGLSFGTRVLIPGLWTATIHDRGAYSLFCGPGTHVDVWMPYGTYQAVLAAGFWSGGFIHRVFIYS